MFAFALAVGATACAATPALGPGVTRLAVQSASANGLDVLAFDENAMIAAIPSIQEAHPTAAALFPNGDWFISLNGHTALRLTPDGIVRWSREVPTYDAVVASDDLVVVTNIIPTGAGRDLLELSALRGDGSPAWHASGGGVTSGLRLVRAPGATLVIHADGESAISDTGAVLWTHENAALAQDIGATYVEGAGLVVVRRPHIPDGATSKPVSPTLIQLLDPVTGAELAHTELVVNTTREHSLGRVDKLVVGPDYEHRVVATDAWTLVDVAVSGNRVVLATRLTDDAVVLGARIEGSSAVETFHVVTVHRDALAIGDTFVGITDEQAQRVIGGAAKQARSPQDEVVLPRIDYAATPIGLEVVDLATHRVRHTSVVSASGVHLGFHRRSEHALAFVGYLDGMLAVGPMHLTADVRQIRGMDGNSHPAALQLVGSVSLK
ncbi:MAG TPA: hypothetical protein VGM90_07565 [Kofleriaceae bacterium]|jgi:hypothetical protein